MEITYYGHSCFGIKIKGKRLLFDPFITPNELAKNIDVDKIKADYIFVSHAREDHTGDVKKIAKRTKAKIVSNYEITEYFKKEGLEDVHPMNHGGAREFDFGKVKYLNAIHTSSFPDGTYGGNPGGFLIFTDEGNFYHSGDTALTTDMQLIPNWGQLRFAMLCIGDNFTMGIDDAVIASDFIACNKIIGMHYDTFGFIKIDHNQAINTFKKAGKELILMKIGETMSF